MANVVAKVRGYFGGKIREAGEVFNVPDDKPAPKWTRPHAFKGKGDHDGDGKTGGSKPAEKSDAKKPDPKSDEKDGEPKPVVVPADWHSLKASERKALAKSITGETVTHVTEADKAIEAYVESTKPAPFSDAPEPETAKDNGIVEATGGKQPDWVAPEKE